MKLYAVLRNLHLIAGTFAAVFLFAYGLSALQMAYRVTYAANPVETTSAIAVPDGVDATPRPLARWLMDQHGVRGDLSDVDSDNGSATFTIVRPGTTHRVEYDSRTRSARVTTRTINAIGMLNRIHHIAGVGHDYWATNAWGWFLLVVSIAILILAGTGVLMWFQRHDERRIGVLVFAAGIAWGLVLLVLIRIA